MWNNVKKPQNISYEGEKKVNMGTDIPGNTFRKKKILKKILEKKKSFSVQLICSVCDSEIPELGFGFLWQYARVMETGGDRKILGHFMYFAM